MLSSCVRRDWCLPRTPSSSPPSPPDLRIWPPPRSTGSQFLPPREAPGTETSEAVPFPGRAVIRGGKLPWWNVRHQGGETTGRSHCPRSGQSPSQNWLQRQDRSRRELAPACSSAQCSCSRQSHCQLRPRLGVSTPFSVWVPLTLNMRERWRATGLNQLPPRSEGI